MKEIVRCPRPKGREPKTPEPKKIKKMEAEDKQWSNDQEKQIKTVKNGLFPDEIKKAKRCKILEFEIRKDEMIPDYDIAYLKSLDRGKEVITKWYFPSSHFPLGAIFCSKCNEKNSQVCYHELIIHEKILEKNKKEEEDVSIN